MWLVIAGALVACAEGAPPGAAAPTPTVISAELLQPLTALGPCTPPEATADPAAADVPGLVLPGGAIAAQVLPQAPVTNVQGYIPLTPIQVRVFYLEHAGVEVVVSEDERWESESLVSDGTHRLFVKAQAVCEQGSLFVAVVAPEADAAFVPAPAGGPGAGPATPPPA